MVALILASGSQSRRRMLDAAGLPFDVQPADIDEDAVRSVLEQEGDALPGDVAEVLARVKAEAVSAERPGAFVIGADQVLSFQGEIFIKPATVEDARDTLLRLRGEWHELHSAAALVCDGETVWSTVEVARLKMRDFDARFVGRYLARTGEAVTQSVGAYQLEGLGAHLFEKIEGDFFTILGLPLLPLLRALRANSGFDL